MNRAIRLIKTPGMIVLLSWGRPFWVWSSESGGTGWIKLGPVPAKVVVSQGWAEVWGKPLAAWPEAAVLPDSISVDS